MLGSKLKDPNPDGGPDDSRFLIFAFLFQISYFLFLVSWFLVLPYFNSTIFFVSTNSPA